MPSGAGVPRASHQTCKTFDEGFPARLSTWRGWGLPHPSSPCTLSPNQLQLGPRWGPHTFGMCGSLHGSLMTSDHTCPLIIERQPLAHLCSEQRCSCQEEEATGCLAMDECIHKT